MMNFFGKLFVLVTFSLSLGFLALAIGVYANHVTYASKDPKAAGIIDKTAVKIKELSYARDRSEDHYRKAFGELGQVERDRDRRQFFLKAKYNMLVTGMDEQNRPVQTPATELEYDKTSNLLVVKMVGATPIAYRGEPLMSLDAYQKALAVRAKDIADEQKKIADLQVQLTDLTTQMQGGQDIVANPGLIRLKELQVDARKRAEDEQEFLKPTLANRFAEAVLLLKREASLRQRLAQLSGKPAAAVGN